MERSLVLVIPPQRGLLEGFATGAIALGNFVRLFDKTTQVKFLDLGLTASDQLSAHVAGVLRDLSGRVFVGITGTTAGYQSMLETARVFKNHDPDCVIIFGGHHASPQDEIVLRRHLDVVDFVVRGEGEVAVYELLRRYPQASMAPNLTFIDSGRIERTKETSRLEPEDLDKLKPTLDDKGLRSAPGKFNHVTYVSARGCPLECAFCAVRATAVRAKTVPAVIKDLRHLVSDRGFKSIAIEDNFFTHSPRRTLDICAAIAELLKEIDFTWDCQTRVEAMRRQDIVDAMARAHCVAAYLGVESLVEEHLRYLGKTLKPDVYLRILEDEVVALMMSAGLDVYINLQLGLPSETQQHRETTLERLERLGAIALSRRRKIIIFPQLNVIYPGTPHFELALREKTFGKVGREVFEEFTAWEAQEEPVLKYLGEHFAHGVGGIPIGIMNMAGLRESRFEIAEDSIHVLSTQLMKMNAVPGVQVFRYGDFLARPT